MDRMRLIDRPEIQPREVFLNNLFLVKMFLKDRWGYKDRTYPGMHEFHATETLLKNALQQMEAARATRITDVYFVIGEISTYSDDTIEGAWQVLAKGTAGEQAVLHFRHIQAEVQCMACFRTYHPLEGEILCPHCGSVGAKIIAGEEFYMEALDVA